MPRLYVSDASQNGAVGGGGRASVGAGQLDLGELDQLLLDMEGESLYGITDTQAKVRHTHTHTRSVWVDENHVG